MSVRKILPSTVSLDHPVMYPGISDLKYSIFTDTRFIIYSHKTNPDISDTIYPASILDTMQVDEQPSEASVFGEALFNGTIKQT